MRIPNTNPLRPMHTNPTEQRSTPPIKELAKSRNPKDQDLAVSLCGLALKTSAEVENILKFVTIFLSNDNWVINDNVLSLEICDKLSPEARENLKEFCAKLSFVEGQNLKKLCVQTGLFKNSNKLSASAEAILNHIKDSDSEPLDEKVGNIPPVSARPTTAAVAPPTPP